MHMNVIVEASSWTHGLGGPLLPSDISVWKDNSGYKGVPVLHLIIGDLHLKLAGITDEQVIQLSKLIITAKGKNHE